MSTELSQLPGTDTLDELAQRIRFKEGGGFELITLARGKIAGQDVNLATFRALQFGADPGALTLVAIPSTLTLAQQDAALVAGAQGGKRLVSYAETFVGGQERSVAAYRG